ncbi:MAG: MFS transporter [Candidatus Nanoarchaeia archaeon]
MEDGRRNSILLGSSSLFNDIGSNAISAILPFYIIAFGGGGIAIGLISGLRDGVSSLFNIIGGWLSDRLGKRKPLVFLGYLISDVFKFLLLIANSWQQIIAFDSSSRVGKFRDSPRDAILAKSKKRRGKRFGFQQMMDSAGAVIGTLLALFLFWKLNMSFSSIILISSIIALVSLVTVSLVKDYKSKKVKSNLFKSTKSLSRNLKYFIFVTSVFVFANFGFYMFLELRAKAITGNIIIPLILFVLFNLAYSIFPIPFGKLSDRIGRKKVLFIGYTLFFLISLCLAFTSNIVYLGILFTLYGLVYAITDSGQRAFISDLSGNMKGTAYGTYYFFTGIVAIAGGIIAGLLWNINYSLMFAFTAVVALISIILLIFVKEKSV